VGESRSSIGRVGTQKILANLSIHKVAACCAFFHDRYYASVLTGRAA
jgi:hypothetical protein